MKQEWPLVKLNEACSLNMGQSPDSSGYNDEGKGLPFYQGNADFGALTPITRFFCNNPTKIAHCGDVLLSVRAPIGAVNIANETCCIGRGLAALTACDNVDAKFLYYAIKSKHDELNAKGTGSTFKAINKKALHETQIPLPVLAEQKNVVSILDNVSGLAALRKRQIMQLDLLAKSRFIEMFGDPVTNPKAWAIVKLKSISQKISDGVHAKPIYTTEGKPFISVVNITRGFVDFTNCKYVSEEAYAQMIRSTHPEKGDILYTKVGATYGIPAYIDTDKEFCLYVSVCLIKPLHDKVNAKFLSHSMAMPYIKRQADQRIKGIGVPDLHLNQIREFDILLPPVALQNRFVAFVEQLDKSKFTIRKSLEQLETLYRALLQEYFG